MCNFYFVFRGCFKTAQASSKCDSVIYLRDHYSFCQHVEQWSHKSLIYYHGNQDKIQGGASVLNKSVQEFGLAQYGRAWDGLWSYSTLKTKLIWGCIRYENAYGFAEGTVLYYETFLLARSFSTWLGDPWDMREGFGIHVQQGTLRLPAPLLNTLSFIVVWILANCLTVVLILLLLA